MAKLLAYILMILGLGLIVLRLAFKQILDKIPVLSNLNPLITIIIGAVLAIAGFLFLRSKKIKHAEEEVPIYKGKEIIGYRRK